MFGIVRQKRAYGNPVISVRPAPIAIPACRYRLSPAPIATDPSLLEYDRILTQCHIISRSVGERSSCSQIGGPLKVVPANGMYSVILGQVRIAAEDHIRVGFHIGVPVENLESTSVFL